MEILAIQAREILDSRGFPTVECDLTLKGKSKQHMGRAAVPSGASTGTYEALELRDGDKNRFHGKGVKRAVDHINVEILKSARGKSFASTKDFDSFLLELDGTDNKSRLGANAILAASMAFVRAQAVLEEKEVFQILKTQVQHDGNTLPVPLMNVVNGGAHADNGLNVQEFMIVPAGFTSFHEALRAGSEVFHSLKKILKDEGLSTSVGDEGGFAPKVEGNSPHESVLHYLVKAIRSAGYLEGKDIFLALDVAATELYRKDGSYEFEGKSRGSSELIAIYDSWLDKFPIISIEDGLGENDWAGWGELTTRLGKKCQIVGDDLFVTNPKFLKRGIESKAANAILIKLNQIGSVSETLSTIGMAEKAGFGRIISHRSGETEDSFIADLAVATDAGQIKTGSLSRSDRLVKYNQLLRIEEMLGDAAKYEGKGAFRF